jgi:hypothetical protein
MSASTAVALSRLIEHGLGPGVVVPVVAGIVVADRGVALMMRARVPMVPAIVVGAALGFVALLVSFDPSFLNPTSSHFFGWRVVSSQFRSARDALANDGTPLPSLIGVKVAIGSLGALAAAATRSIWESQRRHDEGARGHIGPLTGCIAPSLGVFVYSTLVSADLGRVPAALVYFTGAAAFVALSDRAGLDVRSSRPASRLPVGALISCAATFAVLLAASTGLSGMRLSVFHVTVPPSNQENGSQGGSASVRTQLLTGTALVDNLRSVEVSQSNTVIFHASSTFPTYWQVGTLTSFDGSEWLPSSGVTAALAGAPNVQSSTLAPAPLPTPSSGRTFNASVSITDFASRLLPAPPHTLSVRGLPGATAVGQEGVLAATASRAGTAYSVTAQLPPSTPASAAQLNLSDPRLAPYLALPSEPIIVTFLAHEAVGHAATQGAQAQALVNWFRSGKFRYTLDPPPTTGSDPLVQFLTVTRAGFCQQFAGAFGIMARSLGIPTRLVVGFIAGQPGTDGSFTVTGADAHVWPQVYLGPGTGWVSVEPTPPAPGDTTAPAGVVGPNAPPETTQTTAVPSGGHAAGTHVPGTPRRTATHKTAGPGHAGSTALTWLWIALALAGVGAMLWVLLRRGWRIGKRDDDTLPPDQRIVRAWERAHQSLRRRGLGRRPAETPGEYAARLGLFEQRATRRIGSGAVAELVALVELACYRPIPCTVTEAEAARTHASVVIAANRRRH